MLSETLMASDLLHKYFEEPVAVIDTASQDGQRPNTVGGARDGTERLAGRILKGEFGDQKLFILYLQSNQPYVKRQEIATQRAVNEVLREKGLEHITVIINGAGFANKQTIQVAHSELGALISEQYLAAGGDKFSIPIGSLLFSSRDKASAVAPMPPVEGGELTITGMFQHFFDSYEG
jgi:hypothetical protein